MKCTITTSIDFGEMGEQEVTCTVDYTPGTPASKTFPTQEDEPGEDSEVLIRSALLLGIDIYDAFPCVRWKPVAKAIGSVIDDGLADFEEPEREAA